MKSIGYVKDAKHTPKEKNRCGFAQTHTHTNTKTHMDKAFHLP